MINKKNKIVLAAAIVVASLVIGTTIGAEKLGSDKSVQNSVETTLAGVSNVMNTNNTTVATVTSGISEDLYKFDVVDVATSDLEKVSSSNEDETEEEQEEGFCGYVNLGLAEIEEGNLNVRKEATTDSEIVGKMTRHNACEILGTEGEWSQIKSGKVTGYVKSEFLVTGDTALNIAQDEVTTYAKVNTTTLRVRTEASTDASIQSLVGDGEELVVVNESDGWVEVEVDDENGYVSEDYVTLSQKLSTAKTITEVKYGNGVSNVRVDLVSYALQFVGNRYVWGGTSLTNGVDCSGFTMQIYKKYGIGLPHSSRAQPSYGTKINSSEAQPGDLFFYGSGGSIGHVAIYIGNGQIVHASNKRDGIKISNAFYRTPICVVRYFN